MIHALTAAPLSADFKRRLEANVQSPLTYLTAAELRVHGIFSMIRQMRKLSIDQLLLPLEDDRCVATLPLLQALATVTRARSIEIVQPDLSRRSVSRWSLPKAALSTVRGTADGWRRMRQCRGELAKLANQPRIEAQLSGTRRVMYIKSTLSQGLQAGGSIGHVAGVINALHDRGYRIDFSAIEASTMLDPSVEYLPILPPRHYGLPLEVNLYPVQQQFVAKLSDHLGREPYEFIYQRLSLANFAGVVLSRRHGLPLVLEYNGSDVWVHNHWGRALHFQDLAAKSEEVCLRHAHLVVTVSDVLRDELIERGVEPKRIVSYPNCINPKLFDPAQHTAAERTQLLAQYGISPDALVPLFLGTFGQWHGVDVLAHTIRTLATERREWLDRHRVHFMLVGDGSKMAEVRQILADERCRPYYTLVGLVPQAQAPKFLAAADVLLSPHVPNPDGTRFFGSPTKLFEYMAMGKAIAATDLDQIGEVLAGSVRVGQLPTAQPHTNDQAPAVLAEPGNRAEFTEAVTFLVENPAWRKQLGDQARRRALSTYTWDHHVAAILDGLQNVNASGTSRQIRRAA